MSTAHSGQAKEPVYLFFSGKGGVGKTTIAAATALYLARSGLRVLVTSTDPAHSLSDVFEQRIGHNPVLLAPGLVGQETDSSATWSAMSGPSQQEAAEAASGDGSQTNASDSDAHRGRVRRAMDSIIEPLGHAPGVDEYVSLEILLDTMNSSTFDVIVLDTAPTGHTLRLLFLPELLEGWLGRLMTVRGYMQRMTKTIGRWFGRKGRGDPPMDELLTTARHQMSDVRSVLMDPTRTAFFLVTIPEAMSVLETARTMEELSGHQIPLTAVFANQIQPDSPTCPFCHARAAIHGTELERLEDLTGSVPLLRVSARSTVVRGLASLEDFGCGLWQAREDLLPLLKGDS
ncbi:MAG: ArsA family ATPase [Deltaproteobacteria bacterium]|nr:ArsA family ATPase [Deltaproteobacteria bacterium]